MSRTGIAMEMQIFPFLFGRAFIEAVTTQITDGLQGGFPFLFGRAFIEAWLALKPGVKKPLISLPFWKGFH